MKKSPLQVWSNAFEINFIIKQSNEKNKVEVRNKELEKSKELELNSNRIENTKVHLDTSISRIERRDWTMK